MRTCRVWDFWIFRITVCWSRRPLVSNNFLSWSEFIWVETISRMSKKRLKALPTCSILRSHDAMWAWCPTRSKIWTIWSISMYAIIILLLLGLRWQLFWLRQKYMHSSLTIQYATSTLLCIASPCAQNIASQSNILVMEYVATLAIQKRANLMGAIVSWIRDTRDIRCRIYHQKHKLFFCVALN